MISAYEWALKHDYNDPKYYQGEFLVEGGRFAGDSYKLLTVVPLATKGNTRLPERAEFADDIYMYGACMMSSS